MLKYKKINSCICSILFLFLSSKNQNLKLFRYILPIFFLSLSIVAIAQPPIKDGAILAEFSVGDSTKVYFSQGNLQYNVKNKLWRFAEQQYSMLNSPFSWDVRKTNVEWMKIYVHVVSNGKERVEIEQRDGERVDVYVSPDRIFCFPKIMGLSLRNYRMSAPIYRLR